jgi:hypothetical protein
VVGSINISDSYSDSVDAPKLTTAQDPTVERSQPPTQRFAFESALRANTKQTEKLVEQIDSGIDTGKLDEASLDRLFGSIPDDAVGDLFEDYVNFVVDGGKKVYTEWLKTKQ